MTTGNREALLESALTCLLEKGWAATTARDIAHGAKVSLAAIGYHFGSTAHLKQEAIADGFRVWRRHLTEVLETTSGRTPDEAFDALADEMTRLFEEHRPLMRVFLEALIAGDRVEGARAHAAALYQEERVGIASLVRALRRERKKDEALAASILQAAVDGLIVQTVIDPENAPSAGDFLRRLQPMILGRDGYLDRDRASAPRRKVRR